MRTHHSGQRDNESLALAAGASPQALGRPRETALELPRFRQAEAAFETLFACSPLTHHLTAALQAEGVHATVMPSATGPSEATIGISAGDKEAAIEILLRTLHDTQSQPNVNTKPATVLAV
jgi:hypothetical protein